MLSTLLVTACAGGGGTAPAPVLALFAGDMARAGAVDGAAAAARFNAPFGVAADTAGNVYVSDRGNNTMRKITAAGIVSTLAGKAHAEGSVDGIGSAARFNFPRGVATDRAGNVYVSDHVNHVVRKITPAGVVSTVATLSPPSGPLPGPIELPLGVAVSGTSLCVSFNNGFDGKTAAGGVAVLRNRR